MLQGGLRHQEDLFQVGEPLQEEQQQLEGLPQLGEQQQGEQQLEEQQQEGQQDKLQGEPPEELLPHRGQQDDLLVLRTAESNAISVGACSQLMLRTVPSSTLMTLHNTRPVR